eukprot:g18863.t1
MADSFPQDLTCLTKRCCPFLSLWDPAVRITVASVSRYRWIVAIVLCCIILLIIACNALGLGLGTAGIATRGDPYSANACSVSGANFLM